MRLWSIIFIVIAFYACNREPEYKTIDGILEVPENRNDPDSRTLKLVYKVLKAKKADSLKAPIVYLMGGPGGATLIMEDYWKNHPLRNDRDIVLMDQRGTGKSEANCVDLGDAIFTIMRQDLDIYNDYKAMATIMAECKETMKKGAVDLAGYNSRENAADFEDLRKALGYKKWNLFGASYGSRLGLTIMRDFPKGVRSAVLVGILAPESDIFGHRIRNIENSLFASLRGCEENEGCNNRYPNLKERLLQSLKKLQKNPMRFDYKKKPYAFNLQDAFALLNFLLYDNKTIGNLPFFLEALENRKAEPIIDTLQDFESFYNLLNIPMLYSVTAYEELPFYNVTDTNKAIQQSEIGFAFTSYDLAAKLLASWHPHRATDFENQPVASDIPTLMVSGSLDPATPPSDANGALKHLKNGYNVVFPDESHGLFNPCLFQIAEYFINNPLKKPNSECSETRNPIEWNLTTLDPEKS
ncbi:pimeloyl-ACP methyl ester carboxylesterase [Flavobacteriaceae bacterium MAR_2009_75]|nr:pimeloyl-ACP methyl ester carboxylesterase [Flavobacteriaceae bacterium MAR_2009_75]